MSIHLEETRKAPNKPTTNPNNENQEPTLKWIEEHSQYMSESFSPTGPSASTITFRSSAFSHRLRILVRVRACVRYVWTGWVS